MAVKTNHVVDCCVQQAHRPISETRCQQCTVQLQQSVATDTSLAVQRRTTAILSVSIDSPVTNKPHTHFLPIF